MPTEPNIRPGRLRFIYWYTLIGAGGFGLGTILIPVTIRSIFGWPTQDPIVYGVAGSVYLAFGILSIFDLRSPLKFVPILLLQLCYKSIWFIGVILPMIVSRKFPSHGYLAVIFFATYIIGDLFAIPFSYVFPNRFNLQVTEILI